MASCPPPPSLFIGRLSSWPRRLSPTALLPCRQGVAGQREFVHCSGHFPRADCNISRSGNADAVDASLRGFEMPGGYTDDTLVKAVVNNIKAEKKKNPLAYWNITLYDLGKLKTWGDLVCVSQPCALQGAGDPCSTGIRWGVSPAALMGCLRNRSGSPSGADQV